MAADSERIYPCDRCGVMRTKTEGGTVFTVCDECWNESYPTEDKTMTEAKTDVYRPANNIELEKLTSEGWELINVFAERIPTVAFAPHPRAGEDKWNHQGNFSMGTYPDSIAVPGTPALAPVYLLRKTEQVAKYAEEVVAHAATKGELVKAQQDLRNTELNYRREKEALEASGRNNAKLAEEAAAAKVLLRKLEQDIAKIRIELGDKKMREILEDG